MTAAAAAGAALKKAADQAIRRATRVSPPRRSGGEAEVEVVVEVGEVVVEAVVVVDLEIYLEIGLEVGVGTTEVDTASGAAVVPTDPNPNAAVKSRRPASADA